MFAVIDRLGIGLFLWPMFGLAIGYTVALLSGERESNLAVAMILGLIGSIAGGLGLGLLLAGDKLSICNICAAAGALALALCSRLALIRRTT